MKKMFAPLALAGALAATLLMGGSAEAAANPVPGQFCAKSNVGTVKVYKGTEFVCVRKVVDNRYRWQALAPQVIEVVDLHSVCDGGNGVQSIAFSLSKYDGKERVHVQDDGKVSLEIRSVVTGKWSSLGAPTPDGAVRSGGENHLRLLPQKFSWNNDGVRLSHNGWMSNEFPAGLLCDPVEPVIAK